MINHDIKTLPKSRKEAISVGAKYYLTGRPCKRGHVEPKSVANGCAQCHRDSASAEYQADPEPQKKRSMKRYERRREEEPDTLREEGRIKLAKWRSENHVHCLERERDYRDRMRDHLNAKSRENYARDPQKHKDKCKRLRLKDRERKLLRSAELMREWRKNHPELARLHDKNKRAKRKGAEGTFTCEDVSRIREAQKDKCAYCRKPLKGKGTVDHIIALANGGTNWPSNLQLACRSCNSRKRTKDALDFAREHGMLL